MMDSQVMPSLLKPKLPFPCTEKLFKICMNIRKTILKGDRQIIGLFWGKGGSGKSLLAMKVAFLVSGNKFTLDKIGFNKTEFIQIVLSSFQESVLGDEGISLFHAKEAMHRDGIIMQQLIDQTRQKNLLMEICMVDILDTNSIILERLDFACHVWESKEIIRDQNGIPLRDSEGDLRYRTIKGNYALYPRLKNHDYLSPILAWLSLRKQAKKNPLIKLPPPPPSFDRSGGQEFKQDGNRGFYPVPEIEYRAKKEAILNKYKKVGQRKEKNTRIDYSTMDKLLKAKVKQTEIARHLDVALSTVKIRAALISKVHKKTKYKRKNRRKR